MWRTVRVAKFLVSEIKLMKRTLGIQTSGILGPFSANMERQHDICRENKGVSHCAGYSVKPLSTISHRNR